MSPGSTSSSIVSRRRPLYRRPIKSKLSAGSTHTDYGTQFSRADPLSDGDLLPWTQAIVKPQIAAKLCSMSRMSSSSHSKPTDSLNRPSPMPATARASESMSAWVIVAGCAIKLSTPPND